MICYWDNLVSTRKLKCLNCSKKRFTTPTPFTKKFLNNKMFVNQNPRLPLWQQCRRWPWLIDLSSNSNHLCIDMTRGTMLKLNWGLKAFSSFRLYMLWDQPTYMFKAICPSFFEGHITRWPLQYSMWYHINLSLTLVTCT